VYFTTPLTGFPLELGIGAGVIKNRNDGAGGWSKKFQDRFSRLGTIPVCIGGAHQGLGGLSPPQIFHEICGCVLKKVSQQSLKR